MSGGRVLVVDDDPALLQALPEVVRLRMPGVAVDTCDSARAALDRIAAADYDAVVTDIKMPGMDGLALLGEIRALRPDTPTLLITGHGEHDLAVQALRGGAYDFIQKPVDRDYLVASLRRAIRTRQLSREVERQQRALERHAGQLERVVEARTRELREANRAKDQLLLREQAARAEAEAARQRLAFLAEASARLSASLDYPAVLAGVAAFAVPGFADWCAVDVVGDDQGVRELTVTHADRSRLEAVRAARFRHPADPDAPHGVPHVLRTGRPELVVEVTEPLLAAMARDAEHLRALRALGVRSYICVPFGARGRTLGALTFASAESERRYGPADLALAEELARRAALAADNALLYREAQEAARAREAFLARASHELRTPLTSAIATVRLLKRALRGEWRESPDTLIDIASRNLDAMAALVDDLLDVSKLTAGREPLALEPVDVAAAVAASVELVGAQARDKGVELRAAVPASLRLPADRPRLEQVLVNLLANAVKFTPAGGEVAVEAEAVADQVLIRVRDTGEGIEREHLRSIFEPFVQAGEAAGRGAGDRRTRRPRGTGLGLAICRQIVELHGGAIWAESAGPGTGSTFVIRLPRVPAASHAA